MLGTCTLGAPTLLGMPRLAKKPKRRALLTNFVSVWRVRAGFARQEDLAEAIGKSQGIISKIEAGMLDITAENLVAIAKACGVPDPLLLHVHPDRVDLNGLARGLPDAEIAEAVALLEMKRRRLLPTS